MVETLKNRMREGEVAFTFTKTNGETRTALGTLNVDIIAEHNATPSGNGTEGPSDVTRYYDLNSEGWRSFKNDNLVSINN